MPPSSSSFQDDSIYSFPSPQQYNIFLVTNMPSQISNAEKQSLIRSLTTHRVNTLIELRRIERVLAPYGTADIQAALETAWAYYVNSNNLLSELRGLTRSYPFSSEALDEAKWMVVGDPASNRSWNYCWLVLVKMRDQQLIVRHAQQLAARKEMWGGKSPTAAQVQQLATACISEWSRALTQMLRSWETPPTTSGY